MEKSTILADSLSALSDKQLIISWPGHQLSAPLDKPVLLLGRSPQGNDVIINSSVVSRKHATLRWEKGSYYISDGQIVQGEHQPSSNGVYFEGKRIEKHKLENGDVIRIPGENENFVILMYFDASAPPTLETESIELNKEITVGRDERNDLIVPDPLVSAIHFTVSPTPDHQHVLRDLNSSNGTYVNGQPVSQAVLQSGDMIQIGSARFEYNGSELVLADLRRKGIRLDAVDIRKQIKVKKIGPDDLGYRVLLDNVSLSILPHEFVAIVGGSGAGKSTALDALNGFRPAEGQVFINGEHLYQNFDAYRRTIGYVPQDDIIHLELSVHEALRYVARLRLPADTGEEDIEKRIDAALGQVAMLDRKEVLIKRLSGGQRKRVSIAVELIADPGIIFLDEPTSGLDPGLERKMMFTLRQVANAGKTVILVTHATANITECNLVAFMVPGGRLAFYGPPRSALTFFEVDDFAEIYNLVEQEPEKWLKAYQESTYYDTYVRHRLKNTQPIDPGSRAAVVGSSRGWLKSLSANFRQMRILTERYLNLLIRDRRNILFLLLQSPVIGLLLFLVIDPGLFGKGIETEPDDVGSIQKILFVLACIGAWFGLINSIREIVKELPIYRRERLVNLNISAYVASKLWVMLGLGVIQSFLLVFIVSFRVGLPWTKAIFLPASLEVFVTMTLVSFTSACFGLFLSAIMGREDRVMSIMPLFLIPQIVFAGIVFSLEGLGAIASYFVFSRWGIEALGTTVNLPELNRMASFVRPMPDLPFEFAYTPAYLLQAWGVLFGFAALSILATILALKQQDLV